MKQLKEDLKTRKFKGVYLFFGDEAYLKKSYEKKFIESIVPEDVQMMNLDIYDGKDIPVKTIADTSATMPFMNDYRLVIVRNSELFASGRKNDTEQMSEYIGEISESTVLIFIESKVDKRNKLYKAVNSKGYCVEFTTPTELELSKWVIKLFLKNNKKIADGNSVYFLRTVGYSMENIFGEVEKLCTYKKDENEISKEDIENVCTKSLESKIFDLVAAIGNKNSALALEVYNSLILLKEEPIKILTMVVRQLRLILQTKYLLKNGSSNRDIAKVLGQRDFVIKECAYQSKNFTNRDLVAALEDCLECDVNIKTGNISGVLGVELLILKYSSK